MPVPDSRLRHPPRDAHDDPVRTPIRMVGIDYQQASDDLQDVMRMQPPTLGEGHARHNFASIDDAVRTLGLVPRHAQTAKKLIGEVAEDVRNLMGIAKAAREAGIPQEAIPELLRRGIALHYRNKVMNGEIVKAAAPEGTRSTHGGKPVIKRGGEWVPDTKGGPDHAKPVTTKKDGDAKHDPNEKRDGKTAADRHADLVQRAKAAGKTIHGKFDADKHGHEHMDALETQLKQHIANGLAKPGGADSSASDDAPPPSKGASSTPDMGHTRPEAPHQKQALQQQVHDITDQLKQIKGRLDSAHQKAMYKELTDDAKGVLKDPSPQSLQWLSHRTASFIALVTGVAGEATQGRPLGASKPTQAQEVLQEGGKASPQQKAPEKPQEPKKPEPSKAQKMQKAILLGPDGRLYIRKAETPRPSEMPERNDGEDEAAKDEAKDPADEVIPAKPIEDPTEDEPPPQVRMVGFGVRKARQVPPPPPPKRNTPALRKAARAPHPRNRYGHRDGLEPGMILHPREKHADKGSIIVKADGCFGVGEEVFKGGHALLAHLHGTADHRMTVRRYFGLGGEQRVIPRADVTDQLRSLCKSRNVVVQRINGGYALSGDLRKGGIPDYMIGANPMHTRLDAEAGFDLCRHLSKLDASQSEFGAG